MVGVESKENGKLFSKILKTVECWASEVITQWSALCKDYSNTLDTILGHICYCLCRKMSSFRPTGDFFSGKI